MSLYRQKREQIAPAGRDKGRAYSFVACLGRSTIDQLVEKEGGGEGGVRKGVAMRTVIMTAAVARNESTTKVVYRAALVVSDEG